MIAAGDFATAVKEYRKAISETARDALAVAGLAQVLLLQRLDGVVADDVRAAAASKPGDVDAQLAVADLDVSGGHVDDAFARLLDLFPTLDADGEERRAHPPARVLRDRRPPGPARSRGPASGSRCCCTEPGQGNAAPALTGRAAFQIQVPFS